MNTKRLITASIFSLISASTALAADVLIPHQPASTTSSSAVVAPTFSWTGLYLGVQAGGFSSKADLALVGQEKSVPLDKEFSPKLSGFAGGFYAGSNIDLGDSFIFGVDTDLMLSGKKHTKTITIGAADNITVESAVGRSRRSAETPTLPTPQPSTQGTSSAGTGTPASGAGTPAASGAGATPAGGTGASSAAGTGATSAGGAATQSNQAQVRSGSSVQQVQGRSDQSTTNGLKPPAPKSVSSTTEANSGKQPSGVGSSGANAYAGLASTKTVAEKTTSSASSTRSETSQPAANAATSGSSLAERTIPSAPLVLARSASSEPATKASNGTSGAQHGGHHSAHGSGHSNQHGTSHAGGHGSGAHGRGTNPHGSHSHGAQSTQAADKDNSSVYGIEQMKRMASEFGLDQEDEVETLNHTFKQNWGGATRVRVGFSADRFMPYLAGGIAYGQFQDTVSISVKGEDGSVVFSKNLTDETKTMIGYTVGGGVDFAVLDNVIVRAEYRYSDFGKKKFAKEKLEVNYKTNDFRVGVAYKF
ncbi:outer membrane protein [Bartonella tribocorum]|uniref:Hemin-binding protein n=1 Tax=Bartonella tribocorum TaxID=85701 RepID=A0A2M6UTS8_9HYPH|nr:outer membrane protein [Bartonella tribocorum]PIT69586.1 hemin-binding protein [Bartonella tribocorum]